jgi:hypothetical protein
MTDHKEEKDEEEIQAKEKRKKKEEAQFPLPFCTRAPDPEHARAYEEDGPCDDGRSGKTESPEGQQEATEEEATKGYGPAT